MIQALQVSAVIVAVVGAPFSVLALALLEQWRVERSAALR
jgi:hypothetical protein